MMQQLEELFTNPLVKFLIVLLSVKNFINNNILVKFRSLLYKPNGHEAWTPWLYHHTNLMDVSVQVISFTLICSMFICVCINMWPCGSGAMGLLCDSWHWMCACVCVADGLVRLVHQRIYDMNIVENTFCCEHYEGQNVIAAPHDV